MIWTLFFDGLVAALLVVAIVLAMIRNHRFARLGRDRLEFTSVAQEFDAALARAEGSVACLKTTAAGLEAENKRAEAHEEDLRQLIERGSPLRSSGGGGAGASTASRGYAAARPRRCCQAGLRAAGQPAPLTVPRSEAERDLLQALRFKR